MLHYHEILYVEARFHCIYISTTITSAPLKINANLSDIVSSLPQELFIPCHRSYIVNVAHIRLVTRTECLLSRNISIPISRTYTLSVNQAFDRYHQGGIYNYGVDNI
ncbi:MAG: LytTR family DNA-binding domain-containing protein [Christensenellales bacterium]